MPVNMCVVGLGHRGELAIDSYLQSKNSRLLCVVETDEAKRRDFASKCDNIQMFEQFEEAITTVGNRLDAVTIATPHTYHTPLAKQALTSGLDVLVEKPLATGISDAATLVSLAQDSKNSLATGYQWRLHPAVSKFKELIVSGTIGDVQMVSAWLAQRWYHHNEGTWRTDEAQAGGGQLYDSGSHLLDLLLWITGGFPTTVGGAVEEQREDVEVNTAIAAELSTNTHSVITNIGVSGTGTQLDPFQGIVCIGTKGRVSWMGDQIEYQTIEGKSDTIEFESVPYEKLLDNCCQRFLQTAHGHKSPLVSPKESVAVVAFTEAVYRAIETGQQTHISSLFEDTEYIPSWV